MIKYRKYVFYILIGVSLLSIAYILLKIRTSNNQGAANQTNISQDTSTDVTVVKPGDTKQEVVDTLGQPTKSNQSGNTETLYYDSKVQTLDNRVYLIEDGVVLVKEIVPYDNSKKVSDITKVYGLPNYSLFGPESIGGSKLYVYPDKGIAYIGNPKYDAIEEIWYFNPTTIEDFKQKWAPDYSEKEILNLY